jgi:hypothetical protein
MANNKSARLIQACLFSLALGGCDYETPAETPGDEPVTALRSWHLNQAQQAVIKTTHLVNTTRNFIDQPDHESHQAWQNSWVDAHSQWLSASFLIPAGTVPGKTIDNWPIEPGFIDSLSGYPHSGIVNDVTLEITYDTLTEQHRITDDGETTLGFHVLEYYTFDRPLEDFQPGAINADRRKKLVLLVADMLLLDLLTFTRSYTLGEEDTAITYAAMLPVLQAKSQSLFSEFNRLGEHSAFSQHSAHDVKRQLETLSDILNDPIGLNHFLIELDTKRAETLNKLLTEAIGLFPESGSPDESAMSRLLLLIASISHQLEDFTKLLASERQI